MEAAVTTGAAKNAKKAKRVFFMFVKFDFLSFAQLVQGYPFPRASGC
jgi:hypothetical protein